MRLLTRFRSPWLRGLPLLSLVFAQAAQAHHLPPGLEEVDEFASHGAASAVMHPFSGVDHILMALGVGWLAWTLGRKRGGALMGAFLASLMAGVIMGHGTNGFSSMASILAISVALIGVVLASGKAQASGLVFAIVAAAGLLQGGAHGSELSASLSAPLGAIMLGAGTAILCGAGAVLASVSSKRLPGAREWASAALVIAGAMLWVIV